MPSSRPETIAPICDWMSGKSTKDISSVLDVGCGFGKWGFLARLYIQIWTSVITTEQWKNWKNELRVDTIEIYEDYITDLQRKLYNNIYIGDMRKLIDTVENYDLIILGEVIEHVPFVEGLKLLNTARKKSKWTIITTPDYFLKGKAYMGNHYEQHQCLWEDNQFPGDPKIIHVNNQKVIFYDNRTIA